MPLFLIFSNFSNTSLSLRGTTGKRPLDPLSWSEFFSQELYLENRRVAEVITHHVYITPPLAKGPLFVTHHGAGSSGLSFALVTSELRKALPNAGVLSLDARGHGETSIEKQESSLNDSILDLNLSILSQDVVDIIFLTQKEMTWSVLPNVVLVGHSLGGAVAVDVAASGKLGNSLLGYAILDVVEGWCPDRMKSRLHAFVIRNH